jgi:hypothetical protein
MEAHRAHQYVAPATSQTSSRLRVGDVVKARIGYLAVWCSASPFLSPLDDHVAVQAGPTDLDCYCCDYSRLARLRACIYRRLLASKQLSAVSIIVPSGCSRRDRSSVRQQACRTPLREQSPSIVRAAKNRPGGRKDKRHSPYRIGQEMGHKISPGRLLRRARKL